MKKIILFAAQIVLISLICDAQPSNHKITFDFENPTYPKVNQIKPKQSIELKLKNINPYLYEVSIKDSVIVFSNQQPALFGQIFKMPDLAPVPSIAPPADQKVAGQLPVAASPAALAKKGETDIQTDLELYISSYLGKIIVVRDLLSSSKVADDLGSLLDDCSSTLSQLKTKARDFIMNKFPSLIPGSLPAGIQTEVENQSSSIRADLEAFIAQGVTLKARYLTAIENTDRALTLDQYKSIEKAIMGKIEIITNILENAKKLLEKIDAFDTAKVGLAITTNYNKVLSSRIDKTIIRTTRYNTDEVYLNVNVKKKKEIFCIQEVGDFPIDIIVKGGVKIDFSTGIVFNIGSKNFFDQKYHYDSVYRKDNSLADSVTIVRNKNNNWLMPSLGAFFHVYSRWTGNINFGGLVGASLGSDQRVYYHLGGCFLIGKSDRLIIGFGMSIAKTKFLDGQYHRGQIFIRSLAPTTIPTEDPIRIGGFFNVSWNLNLIK